MVKTRRLVRSEGSIAYIVEVVRVWISGLVVGGRSGSTELLCEGSRPERTVDESMGSNDQITHPFKRL